MVCYNFSAGPAMLPEPVMRQAQAELCDWQASGTSVMEVSHRGSAFMAMAAQAEADLRDLLAIPNHYTVLFLQGGASSQFAMVPLNLRSPAGCADYYLTGAWSEKAIKEARRHMPVQVVADMRDCQFTRLPAADQVVFSPQADYVHYTPNETIHGVEFGYIPQTGDVPLVADFSSSILSGPLPVEQFGIIYAGAQKNIGPAGLTLVIIRNDLLGRAGKQVPAMLQYALQAEQGSMYNTPPTFAWYLAGLVFAWLKAQGGLQVMADLNRRKSDALYAAIDRSDFYQNTVKTNCRSRMNIPFTLADTCLDQVFLAEAEQAGLRALKGHRLVGGMRASLYNAMPEAGVQALISFMAEFERRYG
ncbi:MAG: 3-phosphoserine/phosphohydroxythreonine transaminase [Pseudomonadota bacterium]